MELRVGNRYRLGRKIGSGSFGDIYLGKEGGSLGDEGGRFWGSVEKAGRQAAVGAARCRARFQPRRGWAGAAPGTSFHPGWSSGCVAVPETPFGMKYVARGTATAISCLVDIMS
ncbi:hypothetical protein llap_22317 [Limosa lapponica baueri]|uniref:Casein kinase i n=1 Tax=Limosa lapponica baueri TaxID=1758121 RepID=A0A2I0T0Q1_LIMLA|nr:hypothetical protein llap_22317 [Limosa lapponica baueri]